MGLLKGFEVFWVMKFWVLLMLDRLSWSRRMRRRGSSSLRSELSEANDRSALID